MEIGSRDILQANAILLAGVMILMAISVNSTNDVDDQQLIKDTKFGIGFAGYMFVASIGTAIVSNYREKRALLILSQILFMVGLTTVFFSFTIAKNF